ncbi:hypothetical protein ACHQM5_015632 [Ranunculus cassubicifolius]
MVSVLHLFLQILTLLTPSSPWSLNKQTSQSNDIVFEFTGLVTLYKNGSVWRADVGYIPASLLDPLTGVSSKDVVVEPKTGLSARLFLPNITDPDTKLPLLIYFHGGAFIIESAFSPTYHNYVSSIVQQANVVGMSVDYSLAPEYPLPIAYEESWSAIQWAVSRSNGEEWFRKHVDLERIFLVGDSAGGNIAHNMAIQAGVSGLNGLKIEGIVLLDPLFNGIEPVGAEVVNLSHIRVDTLWRAIYPSTTGSDDPQINPEKDPQFSRLGCNRVFVCAAEKDDLIDRDRLYYDKLGKSGWIGVVEFMISPGEGHVFQLTRPTSEHANELMKRVVSFVNNSSRLAV